ncbi:MULTISPECIES: FHA domain-containing protein [Burkholderia]|uniref:FHA domain-containing protein n=1 Tax=Burkholderia TaxID=32008 RepID=UPI000858ECEB|nr:FHA domain-containing protein [Burkholderia sp. MSMB175]AOK30614.1 DNA-binding protein [Burkholderia sp. Bp7605]
MALLENGLSGQLCLLRAHHVLGRDPLRCDTVLTDSYVSRVHASICWAAGQWELHDHSRNGTFVSGALVGAGERVVLREGDLIQLGSAGSVRWRIRQLGEPVDMLWPLHPPAPPIRLEHAHALPGTKITVSRSAHGDWLCDDTAPPRVLRDGDTVICGDFAWQLVLAHWNETGALPRAAQAVALPQRVDFVVSRDEEHVSAMLHTRGGAIDLGARAHHYCLVTLARARFSDARAGYDTASQGWIELDTLARMLGLDESHVNVQIYRARSQFMPLLSAGSPELVERRRGGVRFGALAFRVMRGDRLECQSPCLADPFDAPAGPATIDGPPASLYSIVSS